MTRSRLPARREGYTFTIPHPDPRSTIIWTVKIGFDQGEAKEVFISCNKLTTAMHIAGLEIATLISIALQHGASLKELAAAMPQEEDVVATRMAQISGDPIPPLVPQGVAGAVLNAVIAEIELIQSQRKAAA